MLLINETSRQRITEILQYAHTHKHDLQHMRALAEGKVQPPGNVEAHRIFLPRHYYCVYSVHADGNNGWLRHLSISTTNRATEPGVEACKLIAQEFGFTGVPIFANPESIRSDTQAGKLVWFGEKTADDVKIVHLVQQLITSTQAQDNAQPVSS